MGWIWWDKTSIFKADEKDLKDNCFDISDCPHGLNLLHEFSYLHMAFIVSNKVNDTVAVVPITYKEDDEKYSG